MFSVLAAALLYAASPSDTVFTADGGRITGTVLEESPTTGVTIQLPDGSVRKLDRDEVARIEFADGTVSTPRAQPAAAPPAQPAPAAPAAKPAAAQGPLDNVYLAGGGRVRGTVMEESAGTGVTVRLLDGSVRTYPPRELTRIEYADGTVSTPRAPAKPAEPAPAAKPKPAEPAQPVDNVYFVGGGRVRGTVIEEHPKSGVKVRLLDGSIQVYSREELVRIEYADGSVSRRVTPTPAPAPPVAPAPPPVAPPPQQPAAAPPVAPPPVKDEKPQAFPIYLSLGVGATFLGGDAQKGVPMSGVLETSQAHVAGEIGLRLSPSFAVGVYGDVSGGEPSSGIKTTLCDPQGLDCTGMTTHVGFLVRHTWNPLSRRPTWMSLGTGWEMGGVIVDRQNMGGSSSDELLTYRGREYLRLGAGVDFRSNDVLAFGLYGAFSVGEYDELKDVTGTTTSIDRATHTMGQIGVRLTLFP